MVKKIALAACAGAALLAACQAPHKRLVIPDEMLVRPQQAPATGAPGAAPSAAPLAAAQPASARLPPAAPQATAQPAAAQQAAAKPVPPPAATSSVVLRLAEHGRSWEIELPETSGGYELRLPLGDGVPPIEKPTAADRELLAAGPRKTESGAAAPDDKAAATDAPHGRSYLGALARVTEMFSSKRYELALIELVNLEAEYPQDERIQAMKGTLFARLGKPLLARAAWQKAAALDPQDATVQEALREIGNVEEAQ